MAQRGGEREPTLEEARQDAVKRATVGLVLATVSGALLVRGMEAVASLSPLAFLLGLVFVPLGAAGLFGAAGLLVKAAVTAARVGMTRGPLATADERATERKERRERAVADD
jgi:hypothetical protein